MAEAKRLVTSIDIDEPASTPRDADLHMSISALLELELTDGQRVTLLDDRGWSSSGPSDIWAYTSLEDLADTARTVVGPDEPPDGLSYAQAEADYWASIAAIARTRDVVLVADHLAALPHDVDVSDEIRARVARTQR